MKRSGKPTSTEGGQRSAPITPFLRDQAFDPETVEAMGEAFDTTCKALGLSNRNDGMTNLVAEMIIELAQRGLKNATALHLAAIKAFKSDPQ
jgi:methylmalonyl-CoA mutase cobalamin-binding subunit